MSILIDSHTHLDHFPPNELPDVIHRAQNANVGVIIIAGTTLQSSRRCVELATKYPLLYAGIGLHPMNLEGYLRDDVYHDLMTLGQGSSKVVCISEVGLDFLPTSPDKNIQFQALRRQIGLARELGKPIIFHSRESHKEVFQTLRDERASDVGGVMHYFQGDVNDAHEAISLGFSISFAKPLIHSPDLQEIATTVPLASIVLETDSAPQPWKKHRRNWTEPFQLPEIANKLASLKGMPVEEIINQTTNNITRILRLNQT